MTLETFIQKVFGQKASCNPILVVDGEIAMPELTKNRLATSICDVLGQSGVPVILAEREGATPPHGEGLEPVALPKHFFDPDQRHLLLHEIQRLIARDRITDIIAVDIYRAGYVAAVAAHLARLKCVLVAVHDDAFLNHLNQPGVFNHAVNQAQHVISTDQAVLDHLSVFHNFTGEHVSIPNHHTNAS